MKKYKQVKVNLKEDTHQRLKKYCDSREITMAEYFRSLINTQIEDKREPQQKRVHKKIDPELLYHLNKIGNNLNQIAKHANEGKSLDFQTLAALTNIERTLKEVL